MVVVYSIPSSSYQPGSEPEPTLDEVEILGPPPALSATGPAADKIAKLRLKVNGSTLHAVKARIVMTRQQPIAAGSWAPAGGNWTYIGTPSSGAYEAEWDLAAAHRELAAGLRRRLHAGAAGAVSIHLLDLCH